jgi:histidine kinase
MKRFTGRLWTRLLAAQLLIIALGAVTLIVLVELLAPTFFSNDLRTMNSMMADPSHMGDMMGDMATGSSSTGLFTPTVQADLEASFDSSFRRALAISLVVAGIAAIGTTAYATRRILRPLQAVRSAAHKLAAGAYDQRIDLPNEEELADLAQDVNALAPTKCAPRSRRSRATLRAFSTACSNPTPSSTPPRGGRCAASSGSQPTSPTCPEPRRNRNPFTSSSST